MDTENQKRMEETISNFIADIRDKHPETMCGLIKPTFVSCDAEENSLIMSYPAENWEKNPIGKMQGGIIATLLDFTAGCLTCYQCHNMAVTVSLQVSYLRPGPIDGRVFVKARCTKPGRTLIHTFIEAWPEGAPGKTIATANCVYMA